MGGINCRVFVVNALLENICEKKLYINLLIVENVVHLQTQKNLMLNIKNIKSYD